MPLQQNFLQKLRLLNLSKKNFKQVVALQILDPIEIEFDTDTPGYFVDAETKSRMPLNPAEVRTSYLREFNQFQKELEETIRSLGGDLVILRTDQPPIEALSAYLAHREHRS